MTAGRIESIGDIPAQVVVDSRLEPAEGLRVVRGANPAVRASPCLRRVLVDLFWFI